MIHLSLKSFVLGILALTALACEPTRPFPARSLAQDPQAYPLETRDFVFHKELFEQLFEGETFTTRWSELDQLRQATAVPERTPYQEFWYAYYSGGTNVKNAQGEGALDLYDRAFHAGSKRAAQWEADNHALATAGPDNRWFGHCNGMSVASIRYENPRKSVFRPAACTRGQAGCVEFPPAAIRALLAEINSNVSQIFLGGARCKMSEESLKGHVRTYPRPLDACEDINPGTFHVNLVNYLGRMGQPLIHDQSFHEAVWNYPLHGYRYQARVISQAEAVQMAAIPESSWGYNPDAQGWVYVQMTLQYREFANNLTGAGTFPPLNEKTLEYILELDGDQQVIGGEWIGTSRKDHPDFIWIPFEPNEPIDDPGLSNPHVDPRTVIALWAESVERNPEQPFGDQAGRGRVLMYPRNSELDNWGVEEFYFVQIDRSSKGAVFLEKGRPVQFHLQTWRSSQEKYPILLKGAVFEVFLNGQSVGRTTLEQGVGTKNLTVLPGVNLLELRSTSPITSSNGETIDVRRLNREFLFYAM